MKTIKLDKERALLITETMMMRETIMGRGRNYANAHAAHQSHLSTIKNPKQTTLFVDFFLRFGEDKVALLFKDETRHAERCTNNFIVCVSAKTVTKQED